MSVILTYQLIDSDERKVEYSSVAEAIMFMGSIGEGMFTSAGLTDCNNITIEGYACIMHNWDQVGDLWNGKPDCMHTSTHSGIGGGIHCNNCPAWFCY